MRRSLIRAAALAFLGVWLASKLVPEEQQSILIQLVPMRYIGIGVLFFIEIRLLIMMVQFIITHDANHDLSKQLAEKGDVPEWYAKLMTLEANFWRNVYQRLKHLLGG